MKKTIINFLKVRSVFAYISMSLMMLTFASCTKTIDKPTAAENQTLSTLNSTATASPEDPTMPTVLATVRQNVERKLGDFDWYLVLETGRYEVPTSLDPMYMKDGLKVEVAYNQSEQTVTTTENDKPKTMVDLIYISLVKTQQEKPVDQTFEETK